MTAAESSTTFDPPASTDSASEPTEFVEPPTETEAGDGECVGMLQVEIRRTLNV